MLRIIINVLLLLVIFRLASALVRGARRYFGHNAAARRQGSGADEAPESSPYEDLSPYEIEDADYEEIKSDRD